VVCKPCGVQKKKYDTIPSGARVFSKYYKPGIEIVKTSEPRKRFIIHVFAYFQNDRYFQGDNLDDHTYFGCTQNDPSFLWFIPSIEEWLERQQRNTDNVINKDSGFTEGE
jgi:hypothetical protein